MTPSLRIKIAESMGWRTKENHGSLGGYFAISPEGDMDWYMTCRTPESAVEQVCPNYQNDPAAALTLVDALKTDGWSVTVNNNNPYETQNDDWYCTFVKFPNAPVGCHAPTFSEAICLAYCAVKSIQTDK